MSAAGKKPPPQPLSAEEKISKRLGALETAASSLSSVQPSLVPVLELVPCVSEVATVGQMLRSSGRKLKALRATTDKLQTDTKELADKVAILEHPEEDDKPLRAMQQKTAYHLNKADLRSKRSEKRLRHLKQASVT